MSSTTPAKPSSTPRLPQEIILQIMTEALDNMLSTAQSRKYRISRVAYYKAAFTLASTCKTALQTVRAIVKRHLEEVRAAETKATEEKERHKSGSACKSITVASHAQQNAPGPFSVDDRLLRAMCSLGFCQWCSGFDQRCAGARAMVLMVEKVDCKLARIGEREEHVDGSP